MRFSELCRYFERIEGTTKRLEKTEILAELLHRVDPSEVRWVINLALGQLAAPYERVQFNLAEKMLLRAIAISCESSLEQMTAEFKRIGDMGELVQRLREGGKGTGTQYIVHSEEGKGDGTELEIREVYQGLVKIAQESGSGSQERKVRGLVAIIARSSALESKYIVRMVNESLRLGFSDSTMLDVFSYYESGDKQYSLKLEKVYQMKPDLALLGESVVTKGVEDTIKNSGIELGIPVMPALAQRLGSVDEMIEKMGVVYVEPKLDGTRVQIHFSKNINQKSEAKNQKLQELLFEEEKPKVWVKTFTRNLDENTNQFPELQAIGEQLKVKEVIIDAEAVGYDPATGKLLPFQMTITRKRKHDISEVQKTVPLKFFVFDVLYLDGESLIEKPLVERREILERIVGPGQVLQLNESIETAHAEVIREYHEKQLAKGLEGILVKKKEGIYEPGRAGFNWVKLKEVEDARGKLADTIDCVVMGYYQGKGKRSGFGIGAFLVGVRGAEGQVLTLAKIGTGLTDEQFRELYAKLHKLEIRNLPAQAGPKLENYLVDENLAPDVWVKPEVVVEIAADEITKSPIHSAGYALRFPRLVKFRVDKGLEQITTQKEIVEMIKVAGGQV